jgi:hypothetical protein
MSKALVCIRKDNHIFVWHAKDNFLGSDCFSNLFEYSNVLVLLDPRDSKDGGASYASGNRQLIYVDWDSMWKKTKILWWYDLRRGGFSTESWKMERKKKGEAVKLKESKKRETTSFPLASSLASVPIDDLYEKVFTASENKVCCMLTGWQPFDFAGPGWQVHQVTVDKDNRKLNYYGIKRLLIAGGLLVVNENDEVTHSENPTKIRFNWIVPYGKRCSWTSTNPKKLLKKGVSKEELAKNWAAVESCCDMYLEQHVIVME